MKVRALFTVLLLLSLCEGGMAQELPNPFARPVSTRAPASDDHDSSARPSPNLELRATLVRGRQSSANIGGTIVPVGAKIGNYRLISVHEGAAVLTDSAGATHVLEIAPTARITQ